MKLEPSTPAASGASRAAFVLLAALPGVLSVANSAETAFSWHAPDRAAKVAALIPGRGVAMPPPGEFMAEWTRRQVARWRQEHEPIPPEEAYRKYSATAPADQELAASIPDHIVPFAQVVSGKIEEAKATGALFTYCPFCAKQIAHGGVVVIDPASPHRARTVCCGVELYEREQDCPPDYEHRPDCVAEFAHLDDTVKKVPGFTFTDKQDVTWRIFPSVIFAHRRWLDVGGGLVTGTLAKFKETADPVHVHKLAVLLDRVADVYYGLPLCDHNKLAVGRDGKPLTRAEWNAAPRPIKLGRSYLGFWSRRTPAASAGWLAYSDEYLWVEPFARVRHHPVFKRYSQEKYGDPEALDRKIMTKLMREIAWMFETVCSQRLRANYQVAKYPELVMLSILLGERELFDFAAPNQELTLYNHHYHDGMNAEGAPNYMAMLGGYYAYMGAPGGWLEFAPDFLAEHPFFRAADAEWRKLYTVRGLSLEFGDEHIQPFFSGFLTDPEQLRDRERIPSMNWPGFGIGVLRVGGAGHRQEVFLAYDRASLHGASDRLGIQCWVDGVPVIRAGGYGATWHAAFLDRRRPETRAFLDLYRPREIEEARGHWEWVHCHLAQNTASVDEVSAGRGWSDNEGMGSLITYKGGEAPGEVGSTFQVLDARDLLSLERMGVEADEWRRTLLAVEGRDGRPYAVDVTRIRGGRRHALYQAAWAERVGARLPPVARTEPNLAAYIDKVRPGPPDKLPNRVNYERVRKVEALGTTPEQWEVTWRADYAAYAPRDPAGKPLPRPLPGDAGLVRLRLIGLSQGERCGLLNAKGPWVAWVKQPLPGGARVDGNVAFLDAFDYLIETRMADETAPEQPLESSFVRILEGFRDGESGAIRRVTRLAPGARAAAGTVALRLELAEGHTDTVVFQPEPGTVRLEDGLETDARYALLRRDAGGTVVEAHMVRGSRLACPGFSAEVPGDLKGAIVDIVGDLTGTRQESALIVRPAPESEWTPGAGLAGRQLLVEVTNPLRQASNDGFTIERVTALANGLLRVDLAGHPPFARGWHDVVMIDPEHPNRLKTNRELTLGINTPWLWGAKCWFPELDRTYTVRKTYTDRVTLELADDVDLRAEGVKPGHWFVMYAVEPGMEVTVPSDFAWRREPSRVADPATGPGGPVLHRVRATGAVSVAAPGLNGAVWLRSGAGAWRELPAEPRGEQGQGRLALSGAEIVGRTTWVLTEKPDWLALDDDGPPEITGVFLDGASLEVRPGIDLGRIPPPGKLLVRASDKHSPIDVGSIAVRLDGKTIPRDAGVLRVTVAPDDARAVSVELDLARALPDEDAVSVPVRRRIEVELDDMAVDAARTRVSVSYNKLIKISGDAIHLSDLPEVSSFIHGPLCKDTDYYARPLRLRGVTYAKGLHTHPETGDPTRAEVVYDLTGAPARARLCAIVGVCDTTTSGSVTFEVHTATDGDWEVRYTSPVLRGGHEPIAVSVDVSGAHRLRLYCTDAGDGINSDHAVWCDARLE